MSTLREEYNKKLKSELISEGLDATDKKAANVVVEQLKEISAAMQKLEASKFQDMSKSIQNMVNAVQEYITKTDEEDLSWFKYVHQAGRSIKNNVVASPLVHAALLVSDLENAITNLGEALNAALPKNIDELLTEDPELTVQETLVSTNNEKAAELIAKRWNASFKQAKRLAGGYGQSIDEKMINNISADDVLPVGVQELIDLYNTVSNDEVGSKTLQIAKKSQEKTVKDSSEGEKDVKQRSKEDLTNTFKKVNDTLKASKKDPMKFAAALLAAGLDPSKL